MIKFNERLRQLRKEQNLSQQALGNIVGISKSSINMYERGEREPGIELLEIIADYFNVDIDYLIGKSDKKRNIVLDSILLPLPDTVKIPLIGTIACGTPIFANENLDGFIDAPKEYKCKFALRCKGDSMIGDYIRNGDIVYIREQPIVENGEIAAVLIGNEATLKHVYIKPDRITLLASNNAFEPLVFIGEEMNDIKILGKAIAFASMVR